MSFARTLCLRAAKNPHRKLVTKAEALGRVFHKEWEGKVMDTAGWQSRKLKAVSRLTEEQKRAVELACVDRKNLFIGGGAGSGKTETLLQIKDVMEGRGLRVGIFSLGLKRNPSLGAGETSLLFGLNIGSRPVSPIFVSHGSPNILLSTFRRSSPEFLTQFDALILDDLEQADHDVWRSLRIALTNQGLVRVDHTYAGDPFSGLQVIGAGDFLSVEQGSYSRLNAENFAFDDVSWERTFPNHVELSNQSFVHSDEYGEFLHRLRVGDVKPADLEKLKSRVFPFALNTDPKKDPMYEKTAPLPPVSARKEVPLIVHPNTEDPKGYLASTLKVEKGVPNYKVYSVYYNSPELLELLKTQVADGVATNLRGRISSYLRRYGTQAPIAPSSAGSQGFLHPSTTQAFVEGEDVVLTESVEVDGQHLPAGERGLVVACKDDSVRVNFSGRVVDIYRVTITLQTTPWQCMLVKEPMVEEATRDTAFSTSYSLFPLSGVKVYSSADLYAHPFINGYTGKASSPKTIVDLDSAWTGSLRSLYPVLAHAKDFSELELMHAESEFGTATPMYKALFDSPVDVEAYCYAAARLFHLKGRKDVDISSEPCPVCKQPLGRECPMAERDRAAAGLTPEQKLRRCVEKYEHCQETGVTMTQEEFMIHTRDMTFVRCECGGLVRLKDIEEHREKYVVGTTCMGPPDSKGKDAADAGEEAPEVVGSKQSFDEGDDENLEIKL